MAKKKRIVMEFKSINKTKKTIARQNNLVEIANVEVEDSNSFYRLINSIRLGLIATNRIMKEIRDNSILMLKKVPWFVRVGTVFLF
jgi:hypothetical protein